MASKDMSEMQAKVYEMVREAGVVESICMTRSQIAAAEGLVKRGWLIKGKGFKNTYSAVR